MTIKKGYILCAVMFAATFILTLLAATTRANALSEDDLAAKRYLAVQIQEGDNLFALAEEYRGAQDPHKWVSEVCRMNHLSDPDEITAGYYLQVPEYPIHLTIEVEH